MTATPDLLADPVEGRTYQLHTGPDGLGGTRWHLMRYQMPGPELEWVVRSDGPVWCQVETCTSATPSPGAWRDAAFRWLRSLGHDPYAMDIVLFLDDGYERLRPDTA